MIPALVAALILLHGSPAPASTMDAPKTQA